MARHLIKTLKGKWGRRQRATSQKSVPASSSSSPSPTGALSVSQQSARSTSQPVRSAGTRIDPDTLALSSLQERLWNVAYDKLKSSEPKLVEVYERILSSILDGNDTNSTTCEPIENMIGETRETRSLQMQQLVRKGLDRTQKQASIKQATQEGLQVWQAIRGTVGKAVQMAPEAAVAWAGVSLGLEILANPITEAQNNREGILYVLSRMEWYWNLVALLLDENTSAKSTSGLRDQLRQNIEHLYEKLLLYQMQSVRLYHRKWAVSIARDLFKIDDWSGQLGDIKDAESAVQRDMEQYNTEEKKTRLRELSDAAKTTQQSLQGIFSIIQGQTEQQVNWREDDKYAQIMRDLRETDPRDDKTRIQDAKGGLLRDSYRWILDHEDFQKWRSDPQSQLLWIKGDPGKGKTMLLCGIIDELEKQTDNRLSYFFCQATDSRLNNATAVLRGLVYLLISRMPSLISHVRDKYDHAGRQAFEDGNAWEALSKILASILNDPSLYGAILVIDALDECTINRPRLLSFIKRPFRVKWVVSGRSWHEIEQSLESIANTVMLHLEQNQDSISKAVETYIEYKVDELAQLKTYDEATKDTVKDYLFANADGTFLWVALVCHELADPTITRKRHTLSQLNRLPSGLGPLYMQMMKQLATSRDAKVYMELLGIASVVYRPLTLEELKVLIESMEENDYDDLPHIIKGCGSFLTLREDVVYFVHQSARDFLLDKVSQEVLPNGATYQHHAIFRKSQTALSRILKRDLCKLGNPGFPIDKVLPRDLHSLASLHYACVFWVDHLHDSDPTTIRNTLQDDGAVHQFIQHKYLYWIEFLSLFRSMPEGIRAVHKLEDSVTNLGGEQLNGLLQDARRFILFHKTPIEIAPLQIYASALVFSPARSLIRDLFHHEEPDWMESKPRMERDWNACLQTLEGHSDAVTSLVFSVDGQRLASGSWDSTVKIWDPATGSCLQSLEDHTRSVASIIFSPDGKRLASGSWDNTVKIWDSITGSCLLSLEDHSHSVTSVVLSADGKHLASGSDDGNIKIWDPTTGGCLRTLEGHSESVTSVVFSVGGQRLASGSHDGNVKIWDPTTGSCLQTLEGHSESVTSVVFSVGGQRLASGSHDGNVKIWDPATGSCLQTLKGHSDGVISVVFSADGQRLASGSHDGNVKIWDPATGSCLQTLEGHSDFVASVEFSADGKRLASGSYDKTVRIWDLAARNCFQLLDDHKHPVTSVIFSADGKYLASGSDDETVKIWDPATGSCLQTLEGHSDGVISVVFSANGQRLASGSHDGNIKIWDPATGSCLRTLEGHRDSVTSVVFSPDGTRLASGSWDNTVKIWDSATGSCFWSLEGHEDSVTSLVFSADGQRLASGSWDNSIKIWDLVTGSCLRALESYGDFVASLVFSADGQHLASGSHDETINIWDLATGTCLQMLRLEGILYQPLFNATPSTCSDTETGPLKWKVPNPAAHVNPHMFEETSALPASHIDYGFSRDGVWIVKDGERVLWLPLEYRSAMRAVLGSVVAIGCRSGRILVMKFS